MGLGDRQEWNSFLDEKGVPGIVQQTAIICPESLMGPVDEAQRKSLMAADGMEKYDQAVDPWTAYEVLTDLAAEEARKAELGAEREKLAKEREAFEKQKEKEAFLAQKQKEKEEEAARRKKEKEAEAAEKKKEKAAERRKAQIERSLINTGAQVLKRGLLKTLFK